MRFKNVSPLGDLEIPGVGLVPAGEEFTASGALADSLCEQPSNFECLDAPASPESAKPSKPKEK